jgi:hypothetical protein
MLLTWPETIVFGQAGASIENGANAGLLPSKISKDFCHPSKQAQLALRVGP